MKKIITTMIITLIIVVVVLFSLTDVFKNKDDYQNSLKPIVIIDTLRDTVFVKEKIVIKDTVYKATIDTIIVFKDSTNVIASGSLNISQKNINGVINIRYNFDTNTFKIINSSLMYSGETVTEYIETTKILPSKIKVDKFSLIGLTGGYVRETTEYADNAFYSSKKYSAVVGIGVRIYEKYDILLSLNSSSGIGIMAIYRFD